MAHIKAISDLDKMLANAQHALLEEYGASLPVTVIRALLIIEQKQQLGIKTKYDDLSTELNLTTAGISRMMTQLSEWERINVAGPGYVHIDKAYGDSGKQINVLTLTAKGERLVEKIVNID